MFIKDINGYLLNLNRVTRINIEMDDESVNCRVIENYQNENKEKRKITLYRDKELQLCQEYMNELARKIAINKEIWEV